MYVISNRKNMQLLKLMQKDDIITFILIGKGSLSLAFPYNVEWTYCMVVYEAVKTMKAEGCYVESN